MLAAEMASLLENTLRMVNIALVNEFAQLCAEPDLDTWEVTGVAATKPFGFVSSPPAWGLVATASCWTPPTLPGSPAATPAGRSAGRDGSGRQRASACRGCVRIIEALNDRDL